MNIKLHLDLPDSKFALGSLKIEEWIPTDTNSQDETGNSDSLPVNDILLYETKPVEGSEGQRAFKISLVREADQTAKIDFADGRISFEVEPPKPIQVELPKEIPKPSPGPSVDDQIEKIKSEFESRLQDYCAKQSAFIQSIIADSMDKLKLLKKIFTMNTQQVQNLEKLKKAVLDHRNEDEDEEIEEDLRKLKLHFWNVHEVYINTTARLQMSIDNRSEELKNSCVSIKKYSPTVIAADCVFYQKLCYCKDLLMKFVNLDKNSKFLKEVFTAFIDVFDLTKEQRQRFFVNAKQSFLIK
jgi:hypothetical protein